VAVTESSTQEPAAAASPAAEDDQQAPAGAPPTGEQPGDGAAPAELSPARAALRRWGRPGAAAAAVLVLILLILIDHSGPPPVVNEATGQGVSATTISVTATGDPRVQVVPGSAHVKVDAAGLAAGSVTLQSTSDQVLIVAADARLLSVQSGLVAGFASGGVTLPAHGRAVLRLSGMPPLGTIGSIALDIRATVAPPPG
jgi:hypothetical protein